MIAAEQSLAERVALPINFGGLAIPAVGGTLRAPVVAEVAEAFDAGQQLVRVHGNDDATRCWALLVEVGASPINAAGDRRVALLVVDQHAAEVAGQGAVAARPRRSGPVK